jgi:hypothetical protein
MAIPGLAISCSSSPHQPTLTAAPTLLVSTSAPASTPHPNSTPTIVSAIKTMEGSFRNQISNLEESMPRADSEHYIIPTEKAQKDFELLVSSLSTVDLVTTAQIAAQNNYEFIYYVDRGDDHAASYLLREQKPIRNGWGLYAFRVNSRSNIIIEAPHPLYDKRSPSVALNIYRALDARGLLIAGAHRNANSNGSADVAHASESIFQSVHKTLAQKIQAVSGNAIILQIHGFHTSKHAGYPQAVFGFGAEMQDAEFALAQKLQKALTGQGIKVGLCTGEIWQDLCGTKNAQAALTKEIVFIHIELDEDMRKHDGPLIAALVEVFGK